MIVVNECITEAFTEGEDHGRKVSGRRVGERRVGERRVGERRVGGKKVEVVLSGCLGNRDFLLVKLFHVQ